MAQLHLDPNTHVLNKFKLRCQAEGVPIGKTKKECKDVSAFLPLTLQDC